MKNYDNELDKLMKSLPREEADDYFTTRVSARLGETKKERSSHFMKVAFGASFAAVFATVLAIVLVVDDPNPKLIPDDTDKSALQDQLKALQAEYSALATEMDQIEPSRSELPVYRLGGTDRSDFILDLNQVKFQDAETDGKRAPVTPASQNNASPKGVVPIPAEYQGGSI